jgi:hypothetical protein
MKSEDDVREEVEQLLLDRGLRKKLMNWDIYPHPESALIVLDRMEVHDEYRGAGVADEVMKVFTAYCDGYQFNAELTVRPLDERTTEEGLRRLYSRHGFVKRGQGNDMERRCSQR